MLMYVHVLMLMYVHVCLLVYELEAVCRSRKLLGIAGRYLEEKKLLKSSETYLEDISFDGDACIDSNM